MEGSQLTAAGVAEHHRLHCVHGPQVDLVMGQFFSEHPDRVPTGPAGATVLADAFDWAHQELSRRPAGAAATALRELESLTVLRQHMLDRQKLLDLLDQAAAAYAKLHGEPGVVYRTGGVTADAVHLYSVPGDIPVTMPIPWALAFHATLV